MEKCSITNICSRAMLSILILAVSISSCAVTATPVHSASDPVLYVDPPVYNATHLGETFQVAVSIADVAAESHVVGAEFRLQYNETLLETREEWISEGNFFKRFGDTFFKVIIETDALSQKYIHAFVILLPSENGTYSDFPNGNGTVATIFFNASYRPVAPREASCALRIFDTILIDVDVNTVSHTTRDGLYQIASLPVPTLEVTPREHTAFRKGEAFDVEVNIKDVDRDWRLVGLQFKLQYNTTLLETKPEWITEGDFFRAKGVTWFDAIVEYDYAAVGVMVLPGVVGGWSGPFPEGEGPIATLRFKSIYQPLEPLNSSSCPLALTDTILVNDQGEHVPNSVSNGEFSIVAAEAGIDQYRPLDVQLDVGALHFSGEIADFYVLVADYGRAVDPDNLRAVLYFEGAEFVNLTSSLEHVARGLYRLPYTIPAVATPGTYALVVQAEYIQTSGSAVKSFLLSSTLNAWDTEISDIRANIATVLVPSIGQIRVDLSVVNATLLRVGDRVATIGTSLGNLTTDVRNLNVTLVRIDGNVVTVQTSLGSLQGTVDSVQGDTASIKTDVGTVKVKVSDLQGNAQTSTNLLYVTLVLALIAAVAAAIAVFNTFKKHS